MEIVLSVVEVFIGVVIILTFQESIAILKSKVKKPKSVLPPGGGVIKPLPEETKLHINAQKALDIAEKHGWIFLDYKSCNKMISFSKLKQRINFYYTTRTVSTCMNHPNKGKAQLFRKGVTDSQLEKIFENPRVHTGKGYHKKHKY